MLNINTMNKFMDQLMSGRPQVKCAGLTAEDKAITKQLLAQLDEIETVQAVQQPEVDFIDELNEFMAQEEMNFCEEVDAAIEEAERLYTEELVAKQEEVQLDCDKNLVILDYVLNNDDMKNLYGNKTIKRHRELAPLLNKVPTGCKKSLIEIAMSSYRCTYNQAMSKLAKEFNINYNHDTWFTKQMEILEHNRNLLLNPSEIVIKYPQLWSKMKKEARMRKYFLFLLDLFQTQIEQKGVSYKATSKPLIASASYGFISSSLGKSYEAVVKNMNALAQLHLTRKLTDKKVKQIDKEMHGRILELATRWKKTITTYELILWDEELLQYVNDKLQENKRNKVTYKGQTANSLAAIGDRDVLNKSNKELSQKEKDDIATLKKWFRHKIFDKDGCGFVTKNDYESRFNNPNQKNTIWAGSKKQAEYLQIIFSELNLKSEYASKEVKSLIPGKKIKNIDHRTHVYIPEKIANQLNKYSM